MIASLRVKITIIFLLITSLSLSWVGWSNYQLSKDSIVETLQNHAGAKLQLQSQAMSSWIKTRVAELKVMGRTDTIRFGMDAAQMEYLRHEMSKNAENFTSFGITDPSGSFRGMNGEQYNISGDPSLAVALKGGAAVSEPFAFAAEQPPRIAIHIPVYNRELKPGSVLTATLSAEHLFHQFMNERIALDDTMVLFQEEGKVLFDLDRQTSYSNIHDATSPFRDLASLYIGKPYGFAETAYQGEPHLLLYSQVDGTGWYMAALVPIHSIGNELYQLFWTTVWTVAITEAVLVLIIFLLLNPILWRLRQIRGVAEKAAGGKLNVQPVLHAPNDEIGALALSVEDMAGQISTMSEQLNAMMNLNDYAIIVVNADCTVTYFNRAAEEMTGYKANEVIHKRTLFLWHDEQELFRRAERLSAELGVRILPDISVFLTKPIRYNPEYDQWTFIHKEGSRFPVSLRVSPMRNPDGIVTGYVGIARDISLYKQAEDTRNRLLSIFDAAKDLIASVDDKGNIFYMNPSGYELLEIDELNADTQNTKQYFDTKELHGFIQGLHHLYKNGYWEQETVIRTRSGRQVCMSIMLVVHKDKQGKAYYSVIARDIMEQKRIQAELVTAKQSADRANEAKSLFLARMSHEIRTPLNGILGFSQLLMRYELEEIQREYGSKIAASSRTLLRIVNDILDFSKVEAGKLQLERTRFSLDETVLHVCDMMSVLPGKAAVEVLVDTPEDLPAAVIGDPLRLEQVMLNLCNNALKFTEQGYILVKLEVVTRQAKEVLIEFTVEDSGIGMEPAQVERLFQPFMQADETTSRKYGGTGLGLVISKNLIELMGGSLHVYSIPGEGSRFTFCLPFEQASTEGVERLKLPSARMLCRILLVQHPGKINNRLHTMLEALSLEVTTAASWREGLDLLKHSYAVPFHLALLDMEAEDMYGIETWLELQEVLQSAGTISIVMTTAYGREEIGGLPPEQHPDWVLVKPVSRLALYQMIRAALEQQSSPPELPTKVKLPIAKVSLSPSGAEADRGRILLVEDNEMNQIVAVEMLKNEGYSVTVAVNGLELLEQLGRQPNGWELILMDIQMPEMDGYEATRIIRADRRFNNLPIVALTANVLPEEREACFAAGMNDVLNKPVDMKELASMLQRWQRKNVAASSEASAAMPEIYGIEMERLLDQLNGKVPIVLHILHKFHKEYAHFTTELQELIRDGDWEAARRKIHTLKGVAANLAADRLFAAASSLELVLSEDKTDRFEEIVSAIREEVERMLQSMEQSGVLQADKIR